MKIIIVLSLLLCYDLTKAIDNSFKVNIVNAKHLPISKKEFISIAKEIYLYECARLKYYKSMKITVEIKSLEKDIRGLVVSSISKNVMYLEKDSIKVVAKLKGIFAHDLGHILHFNMLNSTIGTGNKYWDEGFASWIAGKYYLEWQGYSNYKTATIVTDTLKTKYELKNVYSGKTQLASIRDIIYMRWTSFIAYLIEKYSFNKSITLSKLFINAVKRGNKFNDAKPIINKSEKDSILELIAYTKSRFEKMLKDIEMSFVESYTKVYNRSFEDLLKDWESFNAI